MVLPRPPTSERSAGFTLVELIVVVGIIGIILTVGIMSIEMLLPDTRLSATAREMASFIEDARDEAIMSGRIVRLEYDLGEREEDRQRYRSILDPEPWQEQEYDLEEIEYELMLKQWTNVLSDIRINSLLVDEEEEISEGFYSFAAYPNGTMTPHVVQLYSPELDGWYSLQISGLLGQVQVFDERIEPSFLGDNDF